MKANVGSMDRMVRYVAAVVLLSAVFFVDGPNRWFGLLGLVPLLTATLRFCPLYPLIGVNTCGADKK